MNLASGEEPGINHVDSPSAEEMESNDREGGNVSAIKGCYPQLAPDLRPSSPSSDRKMSLRSQTTNSSVPGWKQPFYSGQATSGRKVVFTDRSSSKSLGWVIRMGDADWPRLHGLAIVSAQVLAVTVC